jgi:signal transduction histidine kinase/ligand-binding sensor domain-containing protein
LRSSTIFRKKFPSRFLRVTVLGACIGALSLSVPAYALDSGKAISQYVRDRWGQDRGFLGGNIHAICQSADGYLWIGTERGLVRFDGVNFTLLQRPIPQSPPIGTVYGLVADGEGGMWVHLGGSGLVLYRDGRFKDVLSGYGAEPMIYTAMASDGRGGLLLSGFGADIQQYSAGRFHSIGDRTDIPGTIISLAQTRDGRTWIGTRDDGLFVERDDGITSLSKELRDKKINVLLPAANGGLWIGTDQGMLFWDKDTLREIKLTHSQNQPRVFAITSDQQGNVWVGTDQGLIRSSPEGNAVSFEPGATITAVFLDRDGALWFGGSNTIERLRDGTFTPFASGQELPPGPGGPIYVDGSGRIWYAPASGGLYFLQGDHFEPIHLGGLDKDVVYSITGSGEEVIVGRQHGGVTVLSPNGRGVTARTYTQADGLSQNSVYTVYRSRDGSIWAGTINAGVSRLHDGRFTNYTMAQGLSSNSVNSIIEGDNGTIWLGTSGGLDEFGGNHWTRWSKQDGLPSSNVRTLFRDSAGRLGVVTTDGLALLSSNAIQTPRNLPAALREPVYGIQQDRHGSVWVTTSDHVLRMDWEKLVSGSLRDSEIRSYSAKDGLPGTEGVIRDRSIIADPLGRIWISLQQGVAMVDTSLFSADTLPASARIEEVLAEGKPVDLSASQILAAGTNIVRFSFASTSLSSLETTQFRYKLDGSDKTWSDPVTAREVTYTNLHPGHYVFHVVASNAAGLWNGPETNVPFGIAAAFWQTSWFNAAVAVSCVVLIIAIYRMRVFFLMRQMNLRFQERLNERARIAQDLHDTLLQGVLSASMQLNIAESQLEQDSPAKPLLGRVTQLMSQIIEEGRLALRGLRTTQSVNSSLEMALSRVRQELGIGEQITYRVIANSSARHLRPLIRDEVYRISREAVVNAFRHSSAAAIEVEVDYADSYLLIQVRDDGRGIDPSVLRSGRDGHWGLVGMRERSRSIGADLKVRSRVGSGTEVELKVPGAIAFESTAKPTRAPSRWRRKLASLFSIRSVKGNS